MSVRHSLTRRGKQSASEPVTKTMTFETVSTPAITRANSMQKKANEIETALSINSTGLPQSVESVNLHAKPFNGGLTACGSTNGMPTTTTTNSSSTKTSILYTSTATTTVSNKPLLAISPPSSVQPHALNEQMKILRNSPIKSSTLSTTNKKQKITTNLSQSKLPNYWLSGDTKSTNKFASLAIEDENENNETNTQANSGHNSVTNDQNLNSDKNKNINNKPPPIYVQGVECIKTLKNALSAIANSNFVLKILRNNEVRVQANDLGTYTQIHQMLKQKGTKLHTFKPKMRGGLK